MVYLNKYHSWVTAKPEIYFLSDFADTAINFKNGKTKNSRWSPERERAARRGKDGKFGGLGRAADALTNTTWKKAAIASAALIGVPTATYLGVRNRYQGGIPKSAEMAQVKSSGISVPDLGDNKKQITFTIGGFDGDNQSSYRMQKSFGKRLGDHHLVPVQQDNFNVKAQNPQKSSAAFTKWAKDVGGAFYKTVAIEGRNPVAVELAAQAYAYHQKYPDKQINFIGHSAGGMVASEASDILDKLGVKTKTVALGSPYFGITNYKDASRSITIINDTDPVKNIPTMNPVSVKNERKENGHFLPLYLTNREVLKKVQDFLAA